uniref:Uncharacterized protein n=1 Tax=Trichogramma kaykai TaxID=54128 RepID=A0ABD2XDB2_9HYME
MNVPGYPLLYMQHECVCVGVTTVYDHEDSSRNTHLDFAKFQKNLQPAIKYTSVQTPMRSYTHTHTHGGYCRNIILQGFQLFSSFYNMHTCMHV